MVHVCHNSPHSFQKVSNKFSKIFRADFSLEAQKCLQQLLLKFPLVRKKV